MQDVGKRQAPSGVRAARSCRDPQSVPPPWFHRRAGVTLGHAVGMCLLLLLYRPGHASAAPSVSVVGSPLAASWLRAAGLECRELSADQLAESIPDLPLLVLPLNQLRSLAALRSLTSYAEHGGKVLAIYWGTIARPEQQSAYPVYAAGNWLGVNVAGWSLVGPASVRPELPTAASPGSGQESQPDAPLTRGGELRLGQAMMIQVDPVPSAQVLARLAPESGGPSMVAALRNGNVFYLAVNLFGHDPNPPALRQLFYWFLDQAAPGLVFTQARQRAGEAVAAVIRARERLAKLEAPPAAARMLIDQAAAAAARARSLADGRQFLESVTAADQARGLIEQAAGLMEGH